MLNLVIMCVMMKTDTCRKSKQKRGLNWWL